MRFPTLTGIFRQYSEYLRSTLYALLPNISTCFPAFLRSEKQVVSRACNVRNDAQWYVFLAVAYADSTFTAVKRKPVKDVLHWNSC